MKRNVVAPQSVRISLAVEPFMMMPDSGDVLVQGSRPAQDGGAMLAMAHDLPVLVVIQGSVLQENIVRRLEFAHIVEETRYLKVLQFLS